MRCHGTSGEGQGDGGAQHNLLAVLGAQGGRQEGVQGNLTEGDTIVPHLLRQPDVVGDLGQALLPDASIDLHSLPFFKPDATESEFSPGSPTA